MAKRKSVTNQSTKLKISVVHKKLDKNMTKWKRLKADLDKASKTRKSFQVWTKKMNACNSEHDKLIVQLGKLIRRKKK